MSIALTPNEANGLHRTVNYYTDTTGQVPRLGFLRVDTGGHGRWDRILAKCRDDLQEHALDAGFAPFIRQGMFEITLITTLPQKAQRIQHTVADWDEAARSLIRVAVVPELLNLIAPPPVRTNHRTHSPFRGFDSLPRPGAWKNNGRSRLLANRRSLSLRGQPAAE